MAVSGSAPASQEAARADWVRKVLGVEVAGAGRGAPQGGRAEANAKGVVAYAKSRLIWLATRRKVGDEIDRLVAALVDVYAPEGISDRIGVLFRERVSPVLATLDESLADKLDEASNQEDPARRAALIAEARQILSGYQAYLASEPMIARLDNNPLVPIAVVKTLTASLQAIGATIR